MVNNSRLCGSKQFISGREIVSSNAPFVEISVSSACGREGR